MLLLLLCWFQGIICIWSQFCLSCGSMGSLDGSRPCPIMIVHFRLVQTRLSWSPLSWSQVRDIGDFFLVFWAFFVPTIVCFSRGLWVFWTFFVPTIVCFSRAFGFFGHFLCGPFFLCRPPPPYDNHRGAKYFMRGGDRNTTPKAGAEILHPQCCQNTLSKAGAEILHPRRGQKYYNQRGAKIL